MTSNAGTQRAADRHRIAVVGDGMAGARLAQQLAAGPGSEVMAAGAEVTVIGEEPHAPYNRVLLADVLADRYPPEVIELPAAPGPRRLRGVQAVRIDRAAAEVLCDDGRRVTYDTLVLATGSNPVLPPLRGLFEPDGRELPRGVHAFRTMDDCLALAGSVRTGVRAVVIGGGLLGMSAARALAQRGAQVVLAHQGEHLMERQLDAGASRLLRRHVEALGVEVHTECRVRGLRTVGPRADPVPAADSAPEDAVAGGGQEPRLPRAAAAQSAPRTDRAVSAVELANGFQLDADLVVLACGVRPRVGLAQAAGLEVARGIVVDDELRTSDPDIHAIGDCAEHRGTVYGLAGPALEQADLLARVLAGRVRGAGGRGGGGFHPARSTAAADISSTAGAARTGPHHRYTGTRALTRLTLTGPLPAAAQAPITSSTSPTASPALPGGSLAAPGGSPTASPAVPGRSPADLPDGSPAGQLPREARPPHEAYTGRAAPTAGEAHPALDLAAFGETSPAPGDEVIHLSDATRGAYRKVVVRGDRLVGGILLGDLGTIGALARTWEGDEPLPSAPLIHLLTNDGGS